MHFYQRVLVDRFLASQLHLNQNQMRRGRSPATNLRIVCRTDLLDQKFSLSLQYVGTYIVFTD